MIFSQQTYFIEETRKRYAIRISNMNQNNMFISHGWDFNAKSVSDASMGIYGILLQMFNLGFDGFFRFLIACSSNIEDVRIQIFEYDVNDIIFQTFEEMAVKKANIIKTFTTDQFVAFAKEFDLFDGESVSTTIQLCSKAAAFYGINDRENWIKTMTASFEHMLQLRERKMYEKFGFKPASQYNSEDIKKDIELIYDSMKELNLSRSIIDELIRNWNYKENRNNNY